jgi:hypothetical protein
VALAAHLADVDWEESATAHLRLRVLLVGRAGEAPIVHFSLLAADGVTAFPLGTVATTPADGLDATSGFVLYVLASDARNMPTRLRMHSVKSGTAPLVAGEWASVTSTIYHTGRVMLVGGLKEGTDAKTLRGALLNVDPDVTVEPTKRSKTRFVCTFSSLAAASLLRQYSIAGAARATFLASAAGCTFARLVDTTTVGSTYVDPRYVAPFNLPVALSRLPPPGADDATMGE